MSWTRVRAWELSGELAAAFAAAGLAEPLKRRASAWPRLSPTGRPWTPAGDNLGELRQRRPCDRRRRL